MDWKQQSNSVELITVRPGSAEWDHVQRSLTRSLRTAQVTDIQRVQNKWLHRKYAIQRHLMKDKNGEYSQFSINWGKQVVSKRESLYFSLFSSQIC